MSDQSVEARSVIAQEHGATGRVALVTCVELPEPDPDQQPLLDALARAGVEAELLAWDDPEVDPGAFDLCRFTHAVCKRPRFADGVEQVSEALPVSPQEDVLASKALSCVDDGDLLYARVDLIRDEADGWSHPRWN